MKHFFIKTELKVEGMVIKEAKYLAIARQTKRLFSSGNRDSDLEMSGQFILTNLLNEGL